MDRLKIDIINDTSNNKIHVSIDHGEFQVIQANSIIKTLLKIILYPEKYRVDICDY